MRDTSNVEIVSSILALGIEAVGLVIFFFLACSHIFPLYLCVASGLSIQRGERQGVWVKFTREFRFHFSQFCSILFVYRFVAFGLSFIQQWRSQRASFFSQIFTPDSSSTQSSNFHAPNHYISTKVDPNPTIPSKNSNPTPINTVNQLIRHKPGWRSGNARH